MPLDPHLLRAEHDAGRARADRCELWAVVRGALREDADHALAAELTFGGLEHANIRHTRAPVDLTVDGDHARKREERAQDDDLPQGRLGEETRQSTERGNDENGVGKPVEMVRDDQRRSFVIDVIEACGLDSAVEAPRRDPRDANDQSVKRPPDHQRSVRTRPLRWG